MSTNVTNSSNLTQTAADVFGDLGAIERLNKDLKNSVASLTRDEVRTLVDYYYMIQENRKAANNQISQLEKSGEPHALLKYVHKQADVLENQIKNAMSLWTDEHVVSKVIKDEVFGIGPVISAGLVAFFDIRKAPTAGAFWRYAGLDPSAKWLSRDKVKDWVNSNNNVDIDDLVIRAASFFGRKEETLRRIATTDKDGKPVSLTKDTLIRSICRRPFNASLKTLCWKIGDCFMKFSKKERRKCTSCGGFTAVEKAEYDALESGTPYAVDCKHCKSDITSEPRQPACFYGHIYRKHKQHLIALNQAGQLAKTASETLTRKNIQDAKTLATYKNGQLSDGHIDGMARRHAVKLFISNLHELWCAVEGIPCPQPFAMAHLGHVHYICQPEITNYINQAKASWRLKGVNLP